MKSCFDPCCKGKKESVHGQWGWRQRAKRYPWLRSERDESRLIMTNGIDAKSMPFMMELLG